MSISNSLYQTPSCIVDSSIIVYVCKHISEEHTLDLIQPKNGWMWISEWEKIKNQEQHHDKIPSDYTIWNRTKKVTLTTLPVQYMFYAEKMNILNKYTFLEPKPIEYIDKLNLNEIKKEEERLHKNNGMPLIKTPNIYGTDHIDSRSIFACCFHF